MQNNRTRIGLVIFLLILLGGCAKEVRITPEIIGREPLPSDVIKKLQSVDRVRTVKVLADARTTYKRHQDRFKLVSAIQFPDRVHIDFMEPLIGIFASLTYRPGEALYFSGQKMQYLSGSEADTIFQNITYLPWLPNQMVRILLGGLPDKMDLKGSYSKDRVGRYWIQEGRLAVSVGDGDLKLLHVEDGRLIAEVQFEHYEKRKGGDFPMSVTLRNVRRKLAFHLHYEEIMLNEKIDPKLFEIKNGK